MEKINKLSVFIESLENSVYLWIVQRVKKYIMENLIKFIKIDIVIQKILLFLAMLTSFMVFPLMITLPVLGAWQLFSAAVITYRLKDRKRTKYLIFSVAYLGMMYLSTMIDGGLQPFFSGVIFIPIPFGIAIWYYLETKNKLKELEKLGIAEMPDVMENILDSEEIFKQSEKI